jgi:protein-S-isoprenylcysteine O-methyltransferase Ste14
MNGLLPKVFWSILLMLLTALTVYSDRAFSWVTGLRIALIATTTSVIWRSSPTSFVSSKVFDWVLCVVAALGPLLLEETALTYPIGILIALIGILLAALTLTELDRSFGILPGHREVKTSGPYRIVRHPLYLGYLVATSGWFIYAPSTKNASVVVLMVVTQLLRIRREEYFLMACSDDYVKYRQQTRYRLLPWLY